MAYETWLTIQQVYKHDTKIRFTKPTIQTNNVCRIYYGTVLTLLREYFIQIKCQNSAFSVSENETRVVWLKNP